MSFQATEFEFRTRFWFIAGIFWLGFFLYAIDHVNASIALSRLILGGHADENSRAVCALRDWILRARNSKRHAGGTDPLVGGIVSAQLDRA